MSNLNKDGKARSYRYLLTSWRLAVPAFLAAMFGLSCIFVVGMVLPFSPSNIFLLFPVLTMMTCVILWTKDRWVAREQLAQRAVALLKQTPESQGKTVGLEMKKALANPTFILDLKNAIVASRWKVLDSDVTIGRWEVTLPDTWYGTPWSWCAFGLLSAARPNDVSCLSAERSGESIVLDLTSHPEILNGMVRWDMELTKALGVDEHQVLIQVERFALLESKKLVSSRLKYIPIEPWTECIALDPEMVLLTLSYDGHSYTATTSNGATSQTSHYNSWISMWETWHHFEDADAAMSKHPVN